MAMPVQETPVARLHLRSTVEEIVSHVPIEDWCLRRNGLGWAGVGWGLWRGDAYSDISWHDYERLLREDGKDVNESVQRLYDLPVGALIWTRRRDSSYWLGELEGEWEYRDGEEAQRLDMFNVRPCRWWEVGTQDSVPGKVVNNFSARKTLNPVTDAGAVRYTRRLQAQMSGRAQELEPVDAREVIGSLLGPLDLEDLVAVYLQDCHNFVLVNRGQSTVGYEYVLRDRSTGRRAVASVKSGNTPANLDVLPRDRDVDVWVYTVQERNSTGAPRDDINWIETDELVEFMTLRRSVLPDQVTRWLT